MKNKFILIPLLILLVIVTPLFIGCNSNNGTDGDNTSVSGYLLDLGYENCLICHTGDINPMTHHCQRFDPITIAEIKDESYSPKLSECLLCHLSHITNEKNLGSTLNCAICHQS